jgi:hypothetical protein
MNQTTVHCGKSLDALELVMCIATAGIWKIEKFGNIQLSSGLNDVNMAVITDYVNVYVSRLSGISK